MSRIGIHVSIAGGIDQAPSRARAENCDTFQCFSRSPQGGPAPKLTDELVANFKSEMIAYDLKSFVIHAPYYINLGSPKATTRHASIRIIREELERGSVLGARFVMFHPGSHTGRELAEGLADVKRGLTAILDGYTGSTELLVEISAGSGNVLGDTFDEVGEMIAPVRAMPGFGGICFDTCHAFASGYDFRTPTGAKDILKQFDDGIGLEWLKLTHVNDSKCDLGEHKDRHEHIGKGHIGRQGIAALLTTPSFRAIDWILETEPTGRAADVSALQGIAK